MLKPPFTKKMNVYEESNISYFLTTSYNKINKLFDWLTSKSEILTELMCQSLADNRKICVHVGHMCRSLADSRKISRQWGAGYAEVYLLPIEI